MILSSELKITERNLVDRNVKLFAWPMYSYEAQTGDIGMLGSVMAYMKYTTSSSLIVLIICAIEWPLSFTFVK